MGSRGRIVLYSPQSRLCSEPPHCRYLDELPLPLLTIAAWPLADGYDVELIDGTRYSTAEAHRRVVEACEGALLYGTTGILGHQVRDGFDCTRAVKARHPHLPAFIGGWFASVMPELQLATGLYDAVALGQGELTFRELVAAVASGADLEGVAGLALWRDGEAVRTAPRVVVGWDQLLTCPWHLLDPEPYRAPQIRAARARPPWRFGRRIPGYTRPYFSSFGCPVPCTFCCSPSVTGQRWKAMPAERLLDDVCELQDRWGFEGLEFYDANFGVDMRRMEAFARGLLDRGRRIEWFAYLQSESLLRASPEALDVVAASGLTGCLVGAEAGAEEMMQRIGKRTRVDGNRLAAIELERRGVFSRMSYMIGYPGEDAESMLATLDEALRIHLESSHARPEVWHFRPLPGTVDFQRAVAEGYEPPRTLEEWGRGDDYWNEVPWPGRVPEHVERRRRLFMHFSSLAQGVVRQRKGWWERRARLHLERDTYDKRRLEARAFSLYDRAVRRLPRIAAAVAP